MAIQYEINEFSTTIILRKEMYEREAVLATAYMMQDKIDIVIEANDINEIIVKLDYKRDMLITDFPEQIQNFLKELIDQQLRLDIAKRTECIRNRIYNEAFKSLLEANRK